MNQDELKALQDKYDAEIKEWDAEAAEWDADKRAEYEKERDDFRGQMSAWGDKADAEWDDVKANVEQGWHALRAKWHGWSGGESDNETEENGNLLDDIDDSNDHQ